ncbi:pyrroloquinoline quinone biosynthesis protein [Nocardiopsis listeri]|uniref:pyrroloquinoline quinone biosynthesis protein n=1 Tax=Nocardiopsis listeri TaxID=53440 RepID=UPI0008346157|nr:pyrroloquinoline quinone biosynthesis protein [Nocardiopsis listeri]
MPSTKRLGALAGVAVLFLSACAGPGENGSDTVPRDDPAPPPPEVSGPLPPPLRADPLWAAPFSSEPKATESMFIGVVQEREGGAVEFLGVDHTGRTRWSTERDPECTGFVITRDPRDGSELVVLLDKEKDPDGGFLATRTTASAFRPDDGELVWGPANVPGTLVGPGLVFAAIQGSVMSDHTGPKVALHTGTGAVTADEHEDEVILHEYHGVVLVHRDEALRAVDSTGADLWDHTDLEIPEELDASDVRVGYGPRPADDSAAAVTLVWSAASGNEDDEGAPLLYTVHDLRTGDRLLTLAPDRRPRSLDLGHGRTAVLGAPAEDPDTSSVQAVTDEGHVPLWRHDVGQDTRMRGAAGATLYLDDADTHQALDVRTGSVEQEWEGHAEPPAAALESGPALVEVTTADESRVFAALPVG